VRQWPEDAVYVLPHAQWARRVSGVFANRLAPARAPPAADLDTFTFIATFSGRFAMDGRSGQPEEDYR